MLIATMSSTLLSSFFLIFLISQQVLADLQWGFRWGVDGVDYTLDIFDKNSGVSEEHIDELAGTLIRVYPQLRRDFNTAASKNVKFYFDPNYNDAPAGASNGGITFSADYILDNPNDLEVVTHEAMHLIQAINQPNQPGWLIEGTADYVRDKYGVDNAASGWALPKYDPSQHYTDSYGETAAFLKYVESKYPGTVKKLNDQMRAGTYSANSWKTLTTKTVDQLWTDYGKAPAGRRRRGIVIPDEEVETFSAGDKTTKEDIFEKYNVQRTEPKEVPEVKDNIQNNEPVYNEENVQNVENNNAEGVEDNTAQDSEPVYNAEAPEQDNTVQDSEPVYNAEAPEQDNTESEDDNAQDSEPVYNAEAPEQDNTESEDNAQNDAENAQNDADNAQNIESGGNVEDVEPVYNAEATEQENTEDNAQDSEPVYKVVGSNGPEQDNGESEDNAQDNEPVYNAEAVESDGPEQDNVQDDDTQNFASEDDNVQDNNNQDNAPTYNAEVAASEQDLNDGLIKLEDSNVDA